MQNKRLIASVSVAGLMGWFFASANMAQEPNLRTASTKSSEPTPGPWSAQAANTKPSEGTVVTTDPNQLVINAIHQSVWGPPISYKVHQSTHAYDQDVVVSGEYRSVGGGTGQFRYTARISSGETTIDTIQVSDGRLMYTQIGSKESPKRVIVDQVRQALGNAIHQASERPEISIYLAIGGQPELLRNLYHRYRWYKAVARKVNGIDVWQLVGKLRTEAPKLAGNAPLDNQAVSPPPANSSLPTEAILTLGRSASLPYFPYQIDYLRRIKGADGKPSSLELVSSIVHSEPSPATLSEKDFFFKDQDIVGSIDNDTATYLPTSPIAGQLPSSLK